VRITIVPLPTTGDNRDQQWVLALRKDGNAKKRNWSSKKMLNEIPAIQTNNNRMKKKKIQQKKYLYMHTKKREVRDLYLRVTRTYPIIFEYSLNDFRYLIHDSSLKF